MSSSRYRHFAEEDGQAQRDVVQPSDTACRIGALYVTLPRTIRVTPAKHRLGRVLG